MKKICLLLADGFEAVEASAFTDVLGWNLYEGDKSTKVVTCGTKPVLKCTWNFTVVPDSPVVVDGNIITSYNPSTAFDVAFLLLEKLTSTENTNRVKALMGFK